MTFNYYFILYLLHFTIGRMEGESVKSAFFVHFTNDSGRSLLLFGKRIFIPLDSHGISGQIDVKQLLNLWLGQAQSF